jgi:superfamily II DNA or RNA helicase
MQRVVLRDVDRDSFIGTVGPDRYAEGIAAVSRREVIQTAWEASRQQLSGMVRGEGGEIRTVSVLFRASAGFPLRFRAGYCSCAAGVNCMHVAALFAAATEEPAAGGQRPVARPSVLPWEQSLDSLLAADGDGRPPAAEGGDDGLATGTAPLALELSLVPDGPRARLRARLVVPGKSGAWIAGKVSWSRLDYLLVRDDYPPAQVRLLHELLALYRAASASRNPYYANGYGYGEQKTLDLSACESRGLWPILDQARECGLPLVYPRGLGMVPPPGVAELCLDVTASGRSLAVRPVLREAPGSGSSDGAGGSGEGGGEESSGGGGAGLVALGFIGSEGHGVVYARPGAARGASTERFGIARLAAPAHPRLRAMLMSGERLEVPASGQDAFLARYYPRLRRMATVISSDGSFTPPVISAPRLVMRAAYGGAHDVEISWEWAYRVGGAELRAPLDPTPDGFRDAEAEQRALSAIELPAPLRAAPRRHPVSPSRLRGLDTMRFTTAALPLLSARDDLQVEISGTVPGYREVGDRLRIRLSTAERPGSRDWFDLGISVTVDGHEVPFSELFRALASGRSHLLLPDGAYFPLDKPELAALRRLIEEAQALRDPGDGPLRISRFQAGLWEELVRLGVVASQARSWQRAMDGLLAAPAAAAQEPPPGLRARLRPYQREGFAWLAFLWEHELGGILADDMGLGKTLQALALIAHARAAAPDAPPFVIVAPTSVLANWSAEAARFTPDLKVAVLSDTLGKSGSSLAARVRGADAVVTSYTLLRLDFASYEELRWSGLLLDEAQYVKNHASKAYSCARRLRAPFKVAITGTPMENNLMELWSLLSITAPGLFPSPDRFREFYAKPIEKGGSAELLAQLRQRIRPLIKRRTKEQVAADLPEKQEQVLEVELGARHRKIYQTHLQRERHKVLGLLADINGNRFTILRSLTLLRQLSLHAGLVDECYRDVPSAKIEALLEQITDVAGGGHRALVFSQFTRFLKLARSRLEAAGVECCYLDGTTGNRPAVISSFKNGTAPVFLISLKAGGFGLNLTEADYCFLLDPWWNPATEAQAVDRTHRIGQTRHVMVYRLISAGTIEEKVAALAARKAELFTSVMDHDAAFSSALTAEDIRALFA